MPLIRVRGRGVHVQTTGEGPTVILIHGLVQGHLGTMLFTLAPRLSDRRRVVTYDLRGHGRSDPARRGYDLETLIDDLADLIDAMVSDGEEVDLVGYSYGGTIALRAALDRIPRVRRAVAIDSPLPPFDPDDVSEAASIDPSRAVDAIAGLVEDSFGPEVSRVMGWDREGRRHGLRAERLRRFRSETTLLEDLRTEPVWSIEELAALDVPVLLIYGGDSSFLPTGEMLADHTVGSSRLVVLPGNHYLPLTHPAEVASAIHRFLDG